jgi:outer membrane protein OmpA-like peptidoglycan-associated protein
VLSLSVVTTANAADRAPAPVAPVSAVAATPSPDDTLPRARSAASTLVWPLAVAGAVLLPTGMAVAMVGLGASGLGLLGTAVAPRFSNGAPRPFAGEPLQLAQSRILGAFGLLVVGPPVLAVAALAAGAGVMALAGAAWLHFGMPDTQRVDVAGTAPAPVTPLPQEEGTLAQAPPEVVEAPPPVVAVVVVPDSDQDGLLDPEDRCPAVAGPVENQGCPWGDVDQDTVTDNVDACPNDAGPVDNHGCPWGDQDHDGLADNIDRCPLQAGPPDSGGCPAATAAPSVPVVVDPRCMIPENLAVVIKGDQVLIPTKIQFAPGTSTILRGSRDLLSQIALTLKCRTDITLLRVDGFTDSSGSLELNNRLSLNRAKAVTDYLVKEGKVAPSRLTALGHGPANPIAGNDDAAGREKNRRVEFTIGEMTK